MMTVGLVISRSVEEPSDPSLIFYTVEVDDGSGQPVQYENIVPLDYYRWVSDTGPGVDLVPFEVGQRIPIGVSRFGGSEEIDIMAGEQPKTSECSGGTP
jgi:hypothetical protein